MKLFLAILISVVAFHSTKAELDKSEVQELIQKFKNERNLPEPAVNFLCLVDLAIRLQEIGYNDLSGIGAWANDVIQTAGQIITAYYACDQIKPNEQSTWIEEIRYQICVTAFDAYVEYERYRLTQAAIELAQNDFWIQLVLGLARCGVIPTPNSVIQKSKVEPLF